MPSASATAQTPDERLLDATGWGGDVDEVAQALRDGANPNARQPGTWDGFTISSIMGVSGHTALHQAIDRHSFVDEITEDRTALVRLLLDHGADPNQWSNENTPLGHAASSGSGELVALLLDRGAGKSVLERDTHWGRTPLEAAIVAHESHEADNSSLKTIADAKLAVDLLRAATRQALAEQQAVLHAAAGEVSGGNRGARRRL
ncbi:TPA: ankyrin repeat domain-containing protein [Burkholderia lata]